MARKSRKNTPIAVAEPTDNLTTKAVLSLDKEAKPYQVGIYARLSFESEANKERDTVVACFHIISAKSAKITSNNSIDFACPDIMNHTVKFRSFKSFPVTDISAYTQTSTISSCPLINSLIYAICVSTVSLSLFASDSNESLV